MHGVLDSQIVPTFAEYEKKNELFFPNYAKTVGSSEC